MPIKTEPTTSSQLFERVAWESRQTADDGFGNEQGTFVEQFETYAEFIHLRGGEAVVAARLEGRQPTVVRIRATAQALLIKPDWQMRDTRTSALYAVRSVAPTRDRRWVDVMVEGGVAA